MLLAACTSLTMELGQIAFADRLPALPDLILNLGGGLLGALLFSRKQPAYRD
jgi:glycopeptide antibiotics resistance protein